MAYVNEVRISGYAANDGTRKGNGPVRFAITQGGGKKKDSNERWPKEFFNVSAWPDNCEDAAGVKKNDFVTIEGRLKQVEWKQSDGQTRRSYEIQAKNVHVSGSDSETKAKPIAPDYKLEITDEDIPF